MRIMRSGSLAIPHPKAKYDAGVSRTKQSEVPDSDINKIVDRFMKTGLLPQIDRPPMSGDFAGVSSFQEAQDLILLAKNSFAGLPADLRAKFQNDPANFIAFMDNDPSVEALKSLGIGLKEVASARAGSNGTDAPGGAAA